MHRLLIVTYRFPPYAGGGVARVHAFSKYLLQYGWQPYVLTVADDYHLSQIRDETLISELCDSIVICRTQSLEPKGRIADDFRSGVYGIEKKGAFFERVVKPLVRQVYYALVMPDEHLLWFPYAICRGLGLIERYNIDAILVTSPPHSAGLIAASLGKLADIPLVWDVRDDWIGNPLFDRGPQYRKRIARFLEHQLVRAAHRIVTVTHESLDRFVQKYPDVPANKFECLPNGFDAQELSAAMSGLASICSANYSAKNPMRIIYTGSMGASRSPVHLFEALKSLNLTESQIKFDFFGYSRADFAGISRNMGLNKIVEFHGFVSRKESLRQLIMSDAALVIIPYGEGSQTAIPGKLYEYMGAQKFVLGLCPTDSAVSNLVQELKIGLTCPPHNREQIRRTLQKMLDLYKRDQLKVKMDRSQLIKFERSVQVKGLAKVLEEVL